MWDASFDSAGRLLQSLAVHPVKPQPVAGLSPASPFLDSTLVTERWAPDLSRTDTVSMCGAPPPITRNETQHYMRVFGGAGKVDENRPPGGPPPGGVGWNLIPFAEQRPYYVRDRSGFEWAPSTMGSAELLRRESGRCNVVLARVVLHGPRAPVPVALRNEELTHVPAEVRDSRPARVSVVPRAPR